MQLFVGSNNLIELRGLKNQATNAYVNDATVTATVLDASMVTLATVTLSYVTDTQGTYRGSLSGSTALVAGGKYTIQVVAVSGSSTLTLRHDASADYYSGRA